MTVGKVDKKKEDKTCCKLLKSQDLQDSCTLLQDIFNYDNL